MPNILNPWKDAVGIKPVLNFVIGSAKIFRKIINDVFDEIFMDCIKQIKLLLLVVDGKEDREVEEEGRGKRWDIY